MLEPRGLPQILEKKNKILEKNLFKPVKRYLRKFLWTLVGNSVSECNVAEDSECNVVHQETLDKLVAGLHNGRVEVTNVPVS